MMQSALPTQEDRDDRYRYQPECLADDQQSQSDDRPAGRQFSAAGVDSRVGAERIAGPGKIYPIAELDKLERVIHFFGDQVDFDKDSWRAGRD
jgi:hypothetical protein